MLSSLFLIAYFLKLSSSEVTYLRPNQEITFNSRHFANADRFQIYCYEGKSKSIIYLWQSVYFTIDLNTDDYTQYDGPNPESVQNEYEAQRSSWSPNIFSWKNKNLNLDPFNQSCVGIEAQSKYTIKLRVVHVDYSKIVLLIAGVFLYVSAEKLCRNVFLYYICGVTLGIAASFLILIYFASRLFPRKTIVYGMFATGGTISFYLFHLIVKNLRLILETYWTYVLSYTLISGLVSFALCYRWGPIKDEKTQNLIKWSLQGSSLFIIFLSTQFTEAAAAQIIALLIVYHTPNKWFHAPKTFLRRKFPPKKKWITNEEYYEQGVKETNKSLEELRLFCTSPDCNQWKTMLKLKDARRFASFIEGNSHLSDDEILEYETSFHQTDITDDEESEFTD